MFLLPNPARNGKTRKKKKKRVNVSVLLKLPTTEGLSTDLSFAFLRNALLRLATNRFFFFFGS